MRRALILLLISFVVVLLILVYPYVSLECQTSYQKHCVKDDDCICSTDPCFLGNKEYYQKCFLPQQKEIIQACPDACGFGPYEWEFRTICENNQCKLATFNRTTGERIR
jgi:hypothetical protein